MSSNTNIAEANAKLLSKLSVAFCTINKIPMTGELIPILSRAVMQAICEWHNENGRPDYDPATEPLCDEAVKYAFGKVQQICTLAQISAMTGIGMEGFNA